MRADRQTSASNARTSHVVADCDVQRSSAERLRTAVSNDHGRAYGPIAIVGLAGQRVRRVTLSAQVPTA